MQSAAAGGSFGKDRDDGRLFGNCGTTRQGMDRGFNLLGSRIVHNSLVGVYSAVWLDCQCDIQESASERQMRYYACLTLFFIEFS